MSDNQDALRLADDLINAFSGQGLCACAAAELRRLHAENEALREANEAFGKRQEWWNEKMVAFEALNAALVAAHEREACAKVCEDFGKTLEVDVGGCIANFIRSRT